MFCARWILRRDEPRQRVMHAERCLAIRRGWPELRPAMTKNRSSVRTMTWMHGQSHGTTHSVRYRLRVPCLDPLECRISLDAEAISLFAWLPEPDSRGTAAGHGALSSARHEQGRMEWPHRLSPFG